MNYLIFSHFRGERDNSSLMAIFTCKSNQHHSPEVSPYCASPVTFGESRTGTKFHGVVLIHGGGGPFQDHPQHFDNG